MKTFAEYLPTMTAREREIVEAFVNTAAWSRDEESSVLFGRLVGMRSTPPAKEPESVEGVIKETKDGFFVQLPPGYAWIGGNVVRVTKIEVPQ